MSFSRTTNSGRRFTCLLKTKGDRVYGKRGSEYKGVVDRGWKDRSTISGVRDPASGDWDEVRQSGTGLRGLWVVGVGLRGRGVGVVVPKSEGVGPGRRVLPLSR